MAEEEEEGIDAGDAVRVFVRIRPLNKREIAEKQVIAWDFNETSMLEDTQNGQRVYAYDHCFGPVGSNQETYDIVGKPIVLKAMEGFNGTVFTYGQTGSGKTWTMRGCDADPGMMILCIRDIIEWVDSHPQIKFKLLVSYMEVYNEEINDLLGVVGPASKNLRIVSEDAARGAVIGGLVEEVVKTPADFMEVLQRGEASRSYASTTMNAESSRSHTIYRVTVERVDIEDPNEPTVVIPLGSKDVAASVRISYLNLVDLAGSERQKSTNATGKTLKEGANINKSLLALGAVINKLGESSKKPVKGAKPIFIPYRDSKLTRILKQSLGGNTMTSILCAVTGAGMHREETVSTLKFGQLCKTIKNSVKSNEVVDERSLLKQMRSKIADLELKLEEYERGGGSDDSNPNWIKEKSELEATIQALQIGGSTVTNGGLSGQQVDNSSAFIEALQEQKAENARQTAKISELQRLVTRLNSDLEEFNELDEAKTAFEEYQSSSASELEDLKLQVDHDKQTIQADRYKILSERANLEEKETRLATLLTTLDERDSKLRQLQATLKEQLEQWQRSIVDLQRREDLVDDWQNNHREREKRISEMDEEREIKFNELLTREALLAEHEQKFKLLQRELQEREQRLQVALSRVANAEQTAASIEEKLRASETSLKKRGNESDIREREMLSRRREMESWDILLKEKDKKISAQQRTLDEKIESLRVMDEKARLRESDIDIKESDLKRIDEAFKEDRKVWNQKVVATDNHERELNDKEKKLKKIEENLLTKESDLSKWEKKLIALQEKLKDIDVKDNELSKRIDDHTKVEAEFFNITVGKITQRHSKELNHLEALVAKQLVMVSTFQEELDRTRFELAAKSGQVDEFKKVIAERERSIGILRQEMEKINNMKHSNSSNNNNHLNNVDYNRDINKRVNMDSNISTNSSIRSYSSRLNSLVKPTIGQDLMLQLADTQRVLERILSSNDSNQNLNNLVPMSTKSNQGRSTAPATKTNYSNNNHFDSDINSTNIKVDESHRHSPAPNFIQPVASRVNNQNLQLPTPPLSINQILTKSRMVVKTPVSNNATNNEANEEKEIIKEKPIQTPNYSMQQKINRNTSNIKSYVNQHRDMSDFVERSERQGIPVAKVSLDSKGRHEVSAKMSTSSH